MLCSDGLSGMVADEKSRRCSGRPDGPQAAADALVQAALKGGGEDNVTVVVVDMTADATADRAGDAGAASSGRRPRRREAPPTTVILGPTDRGEERSLRCPASCGPLWGWAPG